MHSALFVASYGTDRIGWGEFLAFVDSQLKDAKHVLRLAENVWLVNAQKSFAPLAHLVALAEQRRVTYGILPFEREPEWLPGGFDPNTIRGQSGR